MASLTVSGWGGGSFYLVREHLVLNGSDAAVATTKELSFLCLILANHSESSIHFAILAANHYCL